MIRLPEQTKRAILKAYKAKVPVAEICAKYDVSKNMPQRIAAEAGVARPKAKRVSLQIGRLTNSGKRRKQGETIYPKRPPKIDPEVWKAACAKRAHYLATVGPYPERVLHPERYGGVARPQEPVEHVRRLNRPGMSAIIGIMRAQERGDYARKP